jgi:hypothetical protein
LGFLLIQALVVQGALVLNPKGLLLAGALTFNLFRHLNEYAFHRVGCPCDSGRSRRRSSARPLALIAIFSLAIQAPLL